MNRTVKATALVLLVGLSLSACKKGGKNILVVTPSPPGTPGPPASPAAFEDQFGAVFAQAFRALANSEPRDVAAGDIIPVNPTAEPVPFP